MAGVVFLVKLYRQIEKSLVSLTLVADGQVWENTMSNKWERLKGKTYPNTLDEQLKSLETDEAILSYREQREQMAKDPYRPIYHMSSISNMGDANGLCQWQDRYHLFYQFGPEGSDRGHWGHCVSADLVPLARSAPGTVPRYRTPLF